MNDEGTNLECSFVVCLERQLDILQGILVIEIHPGIIHQRIDASFPPHPLHQRTDTLRIRDIQFRIHDLGSFIWRECEIVSGPGRGVEGDAVRKGEDAVADGLADAAVLGKRVELLVIAWGKGCSRRQRR